MIKCCILKKSMKYIFIVSALIGMNTNALSAPGDMQISKKAGAWPITIKTCSYDAGAICSLTWNGKEFINDYDHGRQLQSAASFDGLGEMFNPTEAGASEVTNGINPNPSSSVLQSSRSSSNILATQTKMAFWNPVDGQATSNHILNKQVTIGVYGLAHVIEYLTQFNIPADEHHTSGILRL